ncbi:hypothetical protein ACHAQH_009282 [Verticillium albo-atrum]
MDDEISSFAAITNADPEVARGFLEMSGGNLEAAIQLFFENPDIQRSFGAAGASSVPPAVPSSSRPSGTGRQDQPIQIDSEDDDDFHDTNMLGDDDDFNEIGGDSSGHEHAVAVARSAQEEEDAAMAKRLQEELYGSGAGASGGGPTLDDVRSPIRATTETLIAPSFGGGGLNDEEEADMAALLQQERQRAAARARGRPVTMAQDWRRAQVTDELSIGGARNPFNHDASIWDGDGPHRSGGATSASDARAQRLADLFRPPYDLMTTAEWDDAREQGKEDKKWLLVNLQDNSIFQCQMLNRDVWKDNAVQQLVRENFIFIQYAKNSFDSQQYVTFYFPGGSHENSDNFPHVAIVDPRTGEQVKVWSGVPFPSAEDFHAQLAEFLDRYSLDASKKNPVAKDTAKRPKVVDVDRMTEEEMLELALQNSMNTSGGSGGASGTASGSANTPRSNVVDPDALTKEARAATAEAEAAEAAAAAAVPPAAQSGFSLIASDKPHAEPENDPKTTTRIQFRLPTGGRVIRRFSVDDPVRRIFEWLKAEPLEGKDGVDFELKQMPQGQDLLESADQTILEAGLKQGTVMVEFIED